MVPELCGDDAAETEAVVPAETAARSLLGNHGAIPPQTAKLLIKVLEPFQPMFIEEPVQYQNLDVMANIARGTHLPIATGERIMTKWGFREVLEKQAASILQPDICHVGGITEAKKIFTLAEPYQVKSASHGARDIGPVGQAASVHVSLTIPNFGVLEWSDFPQETKDVFPGGAFYHDGYASIQEQPGLGIDIDEAAAAKHPYRKAHMPIVRREDGTMHVY